MKKFACMEYNNRQMLSLKARACYNSVKSQEFSVRFAGFRSAGGEQKAKGGPRPSLPVY